MRPTYYLIIALWLLCGAEKFSHAGEGRYEGYTKWAAKGEKMTPIAATYYGGNGCDEMVGAAELSDKNIVAFGNSWGPEAADAKATVWGKGEHTGKSAYKAEKDSKRLDLESPDRSGFVVWYAPKLASVQKSARFDWGVATILAGTVNAAGELYVCGRCGPAFASLSVQGEGGSFLMKVKNQAPVWILRLGSANSAANRVYLDDHGTAFVQCEFKGVLELWKIDANGQAEKILEQKRANTGNFQSVSKDGKIYFGDDRNTNTGKEPWRQPFYYIYDKTGAKEKTLWEWESKGLRRDGAPAYGEVSDSSPRVTTVDPKNGDLLIGCWSDGGNSVLRRQPTDLAKMGPKAANHFDCSGMKGANSICYILRIDPKTYELKAWSLWQGYFPMDFSEARLRGSPNGCKIKDMAVLQDGSLGFCGGAATGLIQTPNAFWSYPKDGKKFGGEYVAAFNPDLSELLFSSYLPGVEETSVESGPSGLLVAGRSKGTDGAESPTKTPTMNAAQGELHGDYDGWLMLLSLPGSPPAVSVPPTEAAAAVKVPAL